MHHDVWLPLTHEYLETHECVLRIMATDALVLKHQAISINSADKISIVFDQFQRKKMILWWWKAPESKTKSWKKKQF